MKKKYMKDMYHQLFSKNQRKDKPCEGRECLQYKEACKLETNLYTALCPYITGQSRITK